MQYLFKHQCNNASLLHSEVSTKGTTGGALPKGWAALARKSVLRYNSLMKSDIHPQYNHQAQVICVCGNKFTVGSTKDVIHIELCNKCHPFYTGEQRFVDTASRIEKFTKKQEKAKVYQATVTKKKEDIKKKDEGPKSLREMLLSLK